MAVHEIKMSHALEEASKYQILYYIYYLRKKGIDCKKGVIHFPESKRTENINYDPDTEMEIKNIIR
jgi:CRISPR-associated exonuclease Cas4